jgi:uncharacterized membrane protein required for colicin V production
MISLIVVFYMFMVLFGIIGLTRGRTKEFLVALSAVVGIFLNVILETYVPGYKEYLTRDGPQMLFWVRSIIITIVVILGYLTPKLPSLLMGQTAIPKFKDGFWGLAFGLLNGYLIVGSLWSYLADAKYPFTIIAAPDAATKLGQAAQAMIQVLPPNIFAPPALYFVLAAGFIIILGAFV